MNSVSGMGSSGSAPATPRRRGSAAEIAQPQQQQEIPILLRLPDLYPSSQADAAVARLTSGPKMSAPKTSGPTLPQQTSVQRPPSDTASHERSSDRVAADRNSSSRARGSGRSADASARHGHSGHAQSSRTRSTNTSRQWSNRIIVGAFVATVLASGWMVYQRYQRDLAARQSTRTAADRLPDPVPQIRIDRDSFQPEMPGTQPQAPTFNVPVIATRPGENDRVEYAVPGSAADQRYPAAPVAYEQVTGDSMNQTPFTTQPLSPPLAGRQSDASQAASQERIVPFVPRLLRLRDESTAPSGDALTSPYSLPSSQPSR